MRIAIVGSREYRRLDTVRDFVHSLPRTTVVVSGGARGVDWTAEQMARDLGMEVEIFYPDYTKHGKRAPLVRNEQLAERCEEMRAFWDGQSTGTQHALSCAKRLGRPAWVRIGEIWRPARSARPTPTS